MIEFKALNEGTTSLGLWTLIVADPNGERLGYVYFDSTVNVIDCVVADTNSDGKVDLYDALSMAGHFGCRIGDADWNDSIDMNGDLQIDIYDVIILASAFRV